MTVRVLTWATLTEGERRKILARSEQDISDVIPRVREIIDRVRSGGDAALIEYTKQFNAADLAGRPLRVSDQEIEDAEKGLAPAVKEAIRFCADNVRTYHEEQLPGPMTLGEVLPGVYAGERAAPLASVGLYAPRGKGSFPSSTYMMTVPAQVAGVKRIVVVTPPDAAGLCDPATIFAAHLCGAHEIYRVGGVQALAALAYGTQSIRPVVKFLGPGNQYVTAAKRLLYGVVDVGLPAGPSESMVLADGSADPRLLALDVMIEAEHGPDSQALLVTEDEAWRGFCRGSWGSSPSHAGPMSRKCSPSTGGSSSRGTRRRRLKSRTPLPPSTCRSPRKTLWRPSPSSPTQGRSFSVSTRPSPSPITPSEPMPCFPRGARPRHIPRSPYGIS